MLLPIIRMTGALFGSPLGKRSAAVGILDVLEDAIRSLLICDGASLNPLVGFGVDATDDGGLLSSCETAFGVPTTDACRLPIADCLLDSVAGLEPAVGGLLDGC
jgi:hypothetical protein